jgi:hypothetical protein
MIKQCAYRGLEYEKHMTIVVVVQFLARIAKVLPTVRTSEPCALYRHHAHVTNSIAMSQVLEVI